MADRVVVFDMDGVLVDVTESYREAVQQTVAHFTGKRVSRESIQEFKNAGGWNNDWKLSHRMIGDAGIDVAYDDVVSRFNTLFMGANGDGLIVRERWIALPGVLERLAERYRMAIFTGRMRYELDATLARLASGLRFDPLITEEVVPNSKPAPDGLHMIAEQCPNAALWYVGDTVDDAASAREAGVPFIGIASATSPCRDALVTALKSHGAISVLEDINQLETVLPK